LLHGVTSSGKTEIYIHLIDYVLRSGNRAFFLVPEIALTTQLTSRLQDVFGKKVLIYHSKFTDSERVDVWRSMLDNQDPCVVIGARSAVFLPFRRLGLVIVDEEHEPAYKQVDPAPRYNARDAAIVLASMHGAKTLLGSATPSIESYYKALNGKFGLVSLTERFGASVLPDISIADLTAARRENEMRGPMALSTIRKVNHAISEGHQAILFQNRRGFAPIARCTACAWIPKCDFCDVSMTVHRSTGQLVCHYCGATRQIPTVCPQCGEARIEIYGYGTERIESSVNEIFDNARVLRMDLDTTRNKDGHQRIINDFSQGKADILVGTQMVTKGLDFDNVSVVAVMNADTQINLPDFRASERAFNMLEQVAGRAGRRGDVKGEVVIQTYQPDHPLLKFISRHDYRAFYDTEIEERARFFYPPFTRIINIYIKNRDFKATEFVARILADRLRELLGNRVNGPDEPPVARVQSLYIRRIMLKVEINASMVKVKALLRENINSLVATYPDVKRSIIYFDVDPA
ncbi:MAG: primosomal protein N', partial [Muribaculaceae bacterium]|nr:primosomal protein N' [Muribaculaceae bacterium]